MYTPEEVRRETLPFKKGKFTMSKSKLSRISLILDETKLLEMNRCKSKTGASVSKALAVFNCSSGGYV